MSEEVIRQLLALARTEPSGVLEIEAHGVYTMVYVLKGVPVFAEEGTLGETLGRLLLREGRLTQDQYTRIIEHMTSSVMGAEQLRFGEVAVMLGCLTPEQVNEALAMQVRSKVFRCLESEAAQCVFREGVDELEGIVRYPTPVAPLVLRVVRDCFEEARVSRMLEGAASRYPELIGEAGEISRLLEMDPAETACLREIDGKRTALQIIFAASPGARLASRVLAVLQVAGLLRLREEPAVTAVAAATVPPPVAALEPEPAALTRAQLGGVVAPDGEAESVSAAAAAVGTGTAAVSTPAPAGGPAAPRPKSAAPKSLPPVAKQARLRAEQLFQSGKLHVRHERWPLALKDLQEAVRLFPGASEYRLFAQWARFQTLRDPGDMAALHDELERLATEALRQDRHLAFAHHVVGQLKLMRGDEQGAISSFRMASKLDANDQAAARYYRMLVRKHGG